MATNLELERFRRDLESTQQKAKGMKPVLGMDVGSKIAQSISSNQSGMEQQFLREQGLRQAEAQAAAEEKQRNQERLLKSIQESREQALSQGRSRAQELFGAPTKEFTSFARDTGAIQTDIQDIINRRKAALAGMTPEEINAQREQEGAGITQAEQTGLRQLRGALGAAGVRGGVASAQQAALIQQGQQQRVDLERQMFLENLRRRKEALGEFESTIGGEAGRAQSAEQMLRQAEERRKGQMLATELGFGQLGSSERAAAMQQVLGEDQLKAAKEGLEQSREAQRQAMEAASRGKK